MSGTDSDVPVTIHASGSRPSNAECHAALRCWFPNTLPEAPHRAEDQLGLSHARLATLRSLLRSVRPDASEELIASLATWGDVYDWFGQPLVDRAGDLKPYRAFVGPSVRLRPLMPPDTSLLYQAAVDPAKGYRWRYRGRTPSFSEFEQGLFEGVLAQYIVADQMSGHPIGLVAATDPDLTNGNAWFAFMRVAASDPKSRGVMIEGAALFLDHCFRTWPIRKIYLQVPSYNSLLIDGFVDSGLVAIEGRLKDYYRYDGRFYDQILASITGDTWFERTAAWFG